MGTLLTRVLLIWAIQGAALGAENFPPPEFSQDYAFPAVTRPAPRAEMLAYVDMAMLLLALCAAAYLSLRKRSRRDLVVLVIFSLVYFGFFRRGCVCSIGAIQNVALALSDHRYALSVVVGVFFVLPLVFALLFGRVFCAAVCPLGAVQELVLLKPVRLPSWLDSALGVVPFAYLGAAVLYAATGASFIICRYDPFVLFFRLSGAEGMLVYGAAMVLLSIFVGRPYCRYLCPYGALLRIVSPLAKWRASTTPGQCINCHLCADACPYGAIRPPTPPAGSVERAEGRTRLTWLIVGLPVILLAFGYGGRQASPLLARVHPTIRLAERVWLEEQGTVQGQTEASEAFDSLGVPSAELYARAAVIKERFDKGSWGLGIWIGLVLALRLIGLSVRRTRETYQVDPVACVACARCYASCPVEHVRHQVTAGNPTEGTP